jgi:hypothetical protein
VVHYALIRGAEWMGWNTIPPLVELEPFSEAPGTPD